MKVTRPKPLDDGDNGGLGAIPAIHPIDVYSTRLHGQEAKELMLTLSPLMGKRRQEQIKKAVEGYQPSKYKFTEELIVEIKSLSGVMSQSKIAQKFDTDRTTINKIINNKYMEL